MMKLGKGMKVFPLPSMQIELFNQFMPGVKERVGDYHGVLKFELKFVEHMAKVDGMRYDLTVSITEAIPAMDMIAIAQALDPYCTNNAEAYKGADGRFYTLGDGDDSLAVVFEDDAFHIWVRGWPTSEL